MNSYLLVVSGVSSCLQRSQIEFKKEGGAISARVGTDAEFSPHLAAGSLEPSRLDSGCLVDGWEIIRSYLKSWEMVFTIATYGVRIRISRRQT